MRLLVVSSLLTTALAQSGGTGGGCGGGSGGGSGGGFGGGSAGDCYTKCEDYNYTTKNECENFDPTCVWDLSDQSCREMSAPEKTCKEGNLAMCGYINVKLTCQADVCGDVVTQCTPSCNETMNVLAAVNAEGIPNTEIESVNCLERLCNGTTTSNMLNDSRRRLMDDCTVTCKGEVDEPECIRKCNIAVVVEEVIIIVEVDRSAVDDVDDNNMIDASDLVALGNNVKQRLAGSLGSGVVAASAGGGTTADSVCPVGAVAPDGGVGKITGRPKPASADGGKHTHDGTHTHPHDASDSDSMDIMSGGRTPKPKPSKAGKGKGGASADSVDSMAGGGGMVAPAPKPKKDKKGKDSTAGGGGMGGGGNTMGGGGGNMMVGGKGMPAPSPKPKKADGGKHTHDGTHTHPHDSSDSVDNMMVPTPTEPPSDNMMVPTPTEPPSDNMMVPMPTEPPTHGAKAKRSRKPKPASKTKPKPAGTMSSLAAPPVDASSPDGPQPVALTPVDLPRRRLTGHMIDPSIGTGDLCAAPAPGAGGATGGKAGKPTPSPKARPGKKDKGGAMGRTPKPRPGRPGVPDSADSDSADAASPSPNVPKPKPTKGAGGGGGASDSDSADSMAGGAGRTPKPKPSKGGAGGGGAASMPKPKPGAATTAPTTTPAPTTPAVELINGSGIFPGDTVYATANLEYLLAGQLVVIYKGESGTASMYDTNSPKAAAKDAMVTSPRRRMMGDPSNYTATTALRVDFSDYRRVNALLTDISLMEPMRDGKPSPKSKPSPAPKPQGRLAVQMKTAMQVQALEPAQMRDHILEVQGFASALTEELQTCEIGAGKLSEVEPTTCSDSSGPLIAIIVLLILADVALVVYCLRFREGGACNKDGKDKDDGLSAWEGEESRSGTDTLIAKRDNLTQAEDVTILHGPGSAANLLAEEIPPRRTTSGGSYTDPYTAGGRHESASSEKKKNASIDDVGKVGVAMIF